VSGIHLGVVYVDEKWIKIRGVWHYWFVVLDEKTEIPLICYLAKTRSRYVCQWIGLWLNKFPGQVQAVVTDGLKSYRYLLPEVLHVLCHFHHQRGVLTWLKEHLSGSEKQDQPKAKMKQVLQTTDKRTVRRRLDKLEQQAQTWGIQGWIDHIRERLGELLPAIGSRRLPKTTNAIERFFCAFNRFYKVRRGFHSLESARDQLCLFLVGYLFSKRAKDGTAPIETIWPEAAHPPVSAPERPVWTEEGSPKCQGDAKNGRRIRCSPPASLIFTRTPVQRFRGSVWASCHSVLDIRPVLTHNFCRFWCGLSLSMSVYF